MPRVSLTLPWSPKSALVGSLKFVPAATARQNDVDAAYERAVASDERGHQPASEMFEKLQEIDEEWRGGKWPYSSLASEVRPPAIASDLKCQVEGSVGATTSSPGTCFFVGRSEAAAGAPHSPAKTVNPAAKYIRIFIAPIPAIGRYVSVA